MRKLSLIGVLFLSACTIGEDYARPGFSLPEHWPWEQAEQEKPENRLSPKWWEAFQDPVLNALVEEGLLNNDDILRAAGRVAEARGLLGFRKANLYPEIDYEGTATRTSNSANSRTANFVNNSKPFNSFSLATVLNYEFSLWGKFQRAVESGRATLAASEAERDAVRLAVVSDIAAGYFNLRALDAQVKITENTIASRAASYKYQEAQYRLGTANGLIFRQAESELAAARALLPQLQQLRQEQETALAVLVGREPQALAEGNIARGGEIDDLPASPEVPETLPSILLERRPDIAAAEQALIAANANIGVARADYFPTISLRTLLGLASSETDTVLRGSARNWQLSGGISGPILDFGRVSANVDTAQGRKEQAVAVYRQTVRVAFKEVIDALFGRETAAAREAAEADQVNARAEAVRLAGLRYDAGFSNYLEVLDAQRFLYQSQLDRVTARRDAFTAAVNLAKALGGGWKSETLEP